MILIRISDKRRRYSPAAATTLMPSFAAIRGLFPFRGDARDRLASVLDDRDGCGLRRTAIEWRLRSVGHIELNGLGDLLAAQFGRQPQRTIDPGRDARRKHPILINHDALVYRGGAEIG